MPKTFKAPIQIILGTSTSGKSTICKEVAGQDPRWKYIDTDQMFLERGSMDDKFVEHMRSNFTAEEREAFERILQNPRFAGENGERKISQIVIRDQLDSNDSAIPNLRFTELYEETSAGFIANGYDKKLLDDLCLLTNKFCRQLREIDNPNRIYEQACDEAVERSLAGKPTVMDLIYPFQVENFKHRISEMGYDAEEMVKVNVVHLSIPTLTARLSERNRKAHLEDKPHEKRTRFPFDQYLQIFEPSAEGEFELKREDLLDAAEKFPGESREELLERFGFSEDVERVRMSAKIPCNEICNLDLGGDGLVKKIKASAKSEDLGSEVTKPKSWTERVRSDKTQGKSLGGSNEL